MTPAALSALHNAAFVQERGWSAAEFADLLQSPLVQLHPHRHGFALSRTVARQSELLTLVVDPSHRRKGLGRKLVTKWLNNVRSEADEAFLEVAADNHAALALYRGEGFSQTSLRRAYYARKDRPYADAILMRRELTLGQDTE